MMKYILLIVFCFVVVGCDLRPQWAIQADKSSQACIAQGGVPIFKDNNMEKCVFKEGK